MMHSLLHATVTPLDRPTPTYGRTSTWELNSRKVRTVIHIDSSYAFQSRVSAEVWDGDRWNLVVSIKGNDPMLENIASGYLPKERAEEKEMSLSLVEDALLTRVWDIL